jgi:acetyltransferase
MDEKTIQAFFAPKGIILIGASQDPAKLGYSLARNLHESGYGGVIHFVNPRGGQLFGRPIYTDVHLVPDPAELAVLLIPAANVPPALRACGERGIKGAVITAGGFKEIGPKGAAIEQECLQIARSYQMRLLGPNCVGLIDTHLPLNATFLSPPGPLAGDLALLSQSGAICAAVIDWARGQDLGFSRLVSLGNMLDLNETSLLAPTAADPHTKVITLYLEGIGDGRKFLQVAPEITRKKPVLALKVGRSSSGQRAAVSHTGSLAGQDLAYEAAFRRCGVIRATNSEELFDWGRALAWCPPAQGKATAILTNSGGPGVTAADSLEAHGLSLAELSEETLQALRALLPPVASILNPVDLLASATPEQYAACLRYLLDDPGVQNILVILVPPPLFGAKAMFEGMLPIIQASEKPVVAVLMGDAHIQEAVRLLRAVHIPEYRFPERAAAALGALIQRGKYLCRAHTPEPAPQDIDRQAVTQILDHRLNGLTGWLDAESTAVILQAYRIPTPPQILATSLEEALSAAIQLGMGKNGTKIALKIASPDILHKSDIGGVSLNIADSETLMESYQAIMRRTRSLLPEANILGVTLQPMIETGQEVILGAIQDPQFGPLVMFGSGGVEVEGLKDIAFEIAPLTRIAAQEMIESTWAGRKLNGFRAIERADGAAALDALHRLAWLAVDFPQLAEIEINPLRILRQGAFAIDARIRLSRESELLYPGIRSTPETVS